jgi:DMSO/TMAO reductase YedYZ heme-binding membrane subunit
VSPQLWWYVTRATGLVSWGLLSASMLLGLSMSTRFGKKLNQAWATDLHRFLSGFAFIVLFAHLGALLLDDYTDFRVVDLLVPMASRWRPGAVAWGIVGLYLVAIVEVTSLIRDRLTRRLWITLHQLSLPAWLAASIHLVKSGAEAKNRVLLFTVLVMLLALVFLTVLRLMAYRDEVKAERAAALRSGRAARAPRPSPAGADGAEASDAVGDEATTAIEVLDVSGAEIEEPDEVVAGSDELSDDGAFDVEAFDDEIWAPLDD